MIALQWHFHRAEDHNMAVGFQGVLRTYRILEIPAGPGRPKPETRKRALQSAMTPFRRVQSVILDGCSVIHGLRLGHGHLLWQSVILDGSIGTGRTGIIATSEVGSRAARRWSWQVRHTRSPHWSHAP